MKKLVYISVAVLCLGFFSCGRTEKTEEVTAEIEAAQMMGFQSARQFLNQKFSDTTNIDRKLEEARAPKYQFESQGKKREAEAFDSAFVKTIRAVRPKTRF